MGLKYKIAGFIIFSCVWPLVSLGQTLHQDVQGTWRARVITAVAADPQAVAGTGVVVETQKIVAEIIEGERRGQVVNLINDYQPLAPGDNFFLNYLISADGVELYTVSDVDRRSGLAWLGVLFAGVIILFGRGQGVRSLISLALSFGVIAWVLIPLLLKGYPPVLVGTLAATAILCAAIFLTHGLNRESLSAFLGTVMAVAVTGWLASFSIKFLALTGFASDEAIYLNLATGGTLNFNGLLLAGIVIGTLGVLDDIAVTQAAVVAELSKTVKDRRQLYRQAIRVGREHVGALVNTLALAYAGASLPLLLFFSNSVVPLDRIVNQEIFAAEITRTIIGSIGLVLTVPLATLLAVWLVPGGPVREGEHHGHHHGHLH